ncbi:hypothetical protein [Massilia sp. TWP1-3-3]|uniref:hypothetical protein n=1 Tax=Massilia sp. TWP1-3-3 TaxID=2804573 RepID=UPI003CE969F2
MPKTSAERQAAYRARRPMVGSSGERRLNTWVSTAAHLALERIAARDGVTQRVVLERLLRIEDDRILAGLTPHTPEWDAYLGMK